MPLRNGVTHQHLQQHQSNGGGGGAYHLPKQHYHHHRREELMGMGDSAARPTHDSHANTIMHERRENGTSERVGLAPTATSRFHFRTDELFEQHYDWVHDIGSGQFAVVHCVRHRLTGERYAAKHIKKRRYAGSRRGVPRQNIVREVEMLECVGGHDNVIALHEVFETPVEVVLVLELVEGGELFDHVCRREFLDEAEAAAFIRQILVGLRHLHSRHIVHLDIKPENIMLKRKGEAQVKIIDFGLSRRIRPGEVVKDMMGTPEFVAPEVVNYEPLSTATDMWALGVVCYILLSGGSPFLGRNREETFCNISGVNYHFSTHYFAKTSAEAKDFISRLFVRDVRKRATVEECLKHPWIAWTGELLNNRSLSLINVAQIRAFKVRLKWCKAISAVIYCLRVTGRWAARRSQYLKEAEAAAQLQQSLATSPPHLLGPSNDPLVGGGDDAIVSNGGDKQQRGDSGIVLNSPTSNGGRGYFASADSSSTTTTSTHAAQSHQVAAVTLERIASGENSCNGSNGVDAETDSVEGGVGRKMQRLRPSRIHFEHQPSIHFHYEKDDIITSAVLAACEDGDLVALEQLTNVHRINLDVANTVRYPLMIQLGFQLGETPMHVAAGAGHEQVVNFLSKRGCPAAAVDKRGDTPIFWAARNGHALMLRCLLAHMAREVGNGSVMETYPANCRQQQNHHQSAAAELNEKEQEQQRARIEAGIHWTNLNGETALHIATRYAQTEAALALLELGVDVDAEDEHGETALHIASWHGYALLLSILCRFSPRMDLENKDGETALHCAASRGHIECVSSLLESSAPVDAQDQEGQTALHLALRRGHIDIALLLITKGCRLDLQDCNGDSVLHIASQQGLFSCVQTLCHLGAPVDLQNQQHLTALQLAAKEGHTEVVRCLCLAGANIHLKSRDGLTAEILALSQDHNAISQLLARMKTEQAREHFIEQLQQLDSPLKRIKLKVFGHSGVGKTRLLQALQSNGGVTAAAAEATRTAGSSTTTLNSLMDAVSRRWTGSGQSFEHGSTTAKANQPGGPYNVSRSSFGPSYYRRESGATVLSDRSNGGGGGGSGGGSSEEHATSAKTTPTSATPTCASSSSTSSEHEQHQHPADTGNGINGTEAAEVNKNIPGLVNGNYTRGIDVQNVVFPMVATGSGTTAAGGMEFSCWEFGGYEPYHIAYDHFVGNSDCVHCVVVCAADPTEVQYKQALYWMNFLKGRVTPAEPISHCGVVSRRSKVLIVGTSANPRLYPNRTPDGELTSSDAEAMMQTIRLRFGTHFDITERMFLIDAASTPAVPAAAAGRTSPSTHPQHHHTPRQDCAGLRALRAHLHLAKENIVARLQRPIALLDPCVEFLAARLRPRYATFPVVTWPHFVNVVRCDLNPLASDAHCRQLIQQLQLIGEVVYLRNESAELDYVVLAPDWLGTHVLGQLLSYHFLAGVALQHKPSGRFHPSDFQTHYPEINECDDMLHILDTLQLCALTQGGSGRHGVLATEPEFEFPAYLLEEAPKELWAVAKPSPPTQQAEQQKGSGRRNTGSDELMIYGGMRILPMRGMERSLQSTFPRVQVALRRSMNDFQDPLDADLQQWHSCSRMRSGYMEALVRLLGDAVEIQVRGPTESAASCVYFLEDLANLVEQTASEVAPGICLERHFLSPKALHAHQPSPPTFLPEELMQMQQRESLTIRNSDGVEEQFTDVVCFGSREVAAALTLGIDVSVSQLQLASRCELAALLDPPDAMGRDWSILAVKLNLTDQLPEVDSTGQSLSRTDQLLAEWALQAPDTATVGRLCTILEEMDRCDARDVLYRTVPLYLFAPLPPPPPLSSASPLPPLQQPQQLAGSVSSSTPPTPASGNSVGNGGRDGVGGGSGYRDEDGDDGDEVAAVTTNKKDELHDSGLVVSSSSTNSSSKAMI